MPSVSENFNLADVDPNVVVVEAELGIHSATNFYKGLVCEDIIAEGGLFIATYKLVDVGQAVKVRVALPGEYEFEALGVVQWVKDFVHSGSADQLSPGFGVKFTHISREAKQLVYRYVRNRDPLFHDDLM